MAMPKRLSPEQQREVAAKYADGASLKELHAEYSVSFSTIRSYVVANGGTLRNVGRPRKVASDA